jgi:hypothetical protein
MNSPCPQASKDASEGVQFTPADIVRLIEPTLSRDASCRSRQASR